MRIANYTDSNNFKGNIVFINRHFLMKPMDRIEEYLPKQIGDGYNRAVKYLEELPFDVYVARNWDDMDKFEFVVKNGKLKSDNPILIDEKNIAHQFFDTVIKSVNNFKNQTKWMN